MKQHLLNSSRNQGSASRQVLIGFLLAVVVVAVAGRLVPHAPNFTPVGALALFAGLYLARTSRWALMLPLGVMFIADLAIGFYDFKIMAVVYGSFLLYAVFGMLVKDRRSLGTLALATLAGSLLFYLTTNFAVWAFSPLYSATLEGLLLSYTLALPFLKYTLFGDLFFVAVFVGGYELAAKALEHKTLQKAFQRAQQ